MLPPAPPPPAPAAAAALQARTAQALQDLHVARAQLAAASASSHELLLANAAVRVQAQELLARAQGWPRSPVVRRAHPAADTT